ncbi:MAG TPA: hypothetical protein VHH88_06820 [Verrucomicrobiae bacterium]|nr:hypothetical protein [Verrucomicrobiae bacterium]
MKTISLFLFAALLLGFQAWAADTGRSWPGSVNLKNAQVSQILPLYEELAGVELIVDSRAKRVFARVSLHVEGGSKDQALKSIEKALREQAGIVLTSLDPRRVYVT